MQINFGYSEGLFEAKFRRIHWKRIAYISAVYQLRGLCLTNRRWNWITVINQGVAWRVLVYHKKKGSQLIYSANWWILAVLFRWLICLSRLHTALRIINLNWVALIRSSVRLCFCPRFAVIERYSNEIWICEDWSAVNNHQRLSQRGTLIYTI